MSKLNSDQGLFNQPFTINDCLIDPKRNTITAAKQVHQIEPKVMEVLMLLAQHNGEVLEQEFIFDHVWPKSVFSSGSIRRCIALLRKVLDASENTSVITTHSKKGYSLNAKIEPVQNNKIHQVKPFAWLLAGAFLLTQLSLFLNYDSTSEPKLLITESIPLTSSNNEEFNAKISPSGEKLAYLLIDSNSANIRSLWLKDLTTEQTIPLVRDNAREFAWSPEGDRIIYLTGSRFNETISIINLNNTQQQVSSDLTITQARISSLHWGNLGNLYFLEKTTSFTALTELNIDTGNKEHLLSFDSSFTPYEIALSVSQNKLAIAGYDSNGISLIRSYDLENRHYSEVTKLNENRYFVNWHPTGNSLLLSDGQLLYTVSSTGELAQLNYQNFDFLLQPHFTPDGQNIIFTKAKIDIDIALAELTSVETTTKLIDSNTVDRAAAISPDQKRIAFVSQRKGYPQVYLYNLHTKETELIYQNKQKLLGISKPIWHPEGNQLAFSNYEFPVIISFTNQGYKLDEWQKPVGIVKDWYAKENAILTVSAKRNSVQKIELETKADTFLADASTPYLVLSLDDHLLQATTNKIINTKTQKTLLHIDGKIKEIIKVDTRLFITAKQEEEQRIIIFDLVSNQVSSNQVLPKHIKAVSAIIGDKVLYESKSQQKDILLLRLAHTENEKVEH